MIPASISISQEYFFAAGAVLEESSPQAVKSAAPATMETNSNFFILKIEFVQEFRARVASITRIVEVDRHGVAVIIVTIADHRSTAIATIIFDTGNRRVVVSFSPEFTAGPCGSHRRRSGHADMVCNTTIFSPSCVAGRIFDSDFTAREKSQIKSYLICVSYRMKYNKKIWKIQTRAYQIIILHKYFLFIT